MKSQSSLCGTRPTSNQSFILVCIIALSVLIVPECAYAVPVGNEFQINSHEPGLV